MDYVDYTLLAKRGLLKIKKEEEGTVKVDKQGYVDYGSFMGKTENNSGSAGSTSNSSSNPLGSFFDSATSGSASSPTSSSGFSSFFGSENSSSSPSSSSGASDLGFNQLKLKVDDMEYKLDNIIARLSDIENRFS